MTLPAGNKRQRGDAIAGFKLLAAIRADFDNLTAKLVPHNAARGQRRHATAVIMHLSHVQIRAADTAASHRDD